MDLKRLRIVFILLVFTAALQACTPQEIPAEDAIATAVVATIAAESGENPPDTPPPPPSPTW